MPVWFLFTSGAIVLLRRLLSKHTSLSHAAAELSPAPRTGEGCCKFLLTYQLSRRLQGCMQRMLYCQQIQIPTFVSLSFRVIHF